MWAAKYLIIMLVILSGVGVQAQTDTPTPTNTPTITPTSFGSVPDEELHNLMATQAANTNSLPDDISRPVNNQSIVQDVDLRPLFGLVKWLFSANAAQELLGPTLAPLGLSIFTLFMITVIMIGVYLLVFVITIGIRFYWWVTNNILRMIEAIPVFE